jgi:energy-coupling factor transporter ATP-binding protein EcfA2
MIEAQEVNFAYRRGEPVLHDISCSIADGESLALLGHNGSGKTTLTRLFMALDHPRSGQVLIDGNNIEKCEPADLADKIGYVFQNPDLQILEDTVFDEVAYGLKNKELSEENIKHQVELALEAMGLSEFADIYPRSLSFGQKRRLGVAAALALNPRNLILDEITNGQDEQEKEMMMNYLKKLNTEKHITIILITHDMEIARKYTKRSLVLFDGDLVFDGATDKLFDGIKDLAPWGLTQPPLAKLGAVFGINALETAAFCNGLELKGAEAK